jgi:hypothetical protein
MKRIALIAAAAVLAAPAVFAQSAATIQSGGTIILEGPATSKPIHGAVIAEAPVLGSSVVAVAPSTTVLGAGPAVVTAGPSSSVTIVRHYWNVPADINSRDDFRRWQRLL